MAVVPGDLLEVEGWFFIRRGELFAGFVVLWRHPVDGLSGVYRGDMGWSSPPPARVDGALLAAAAHDAVSDAEGDFRREGGYFARDLRIAPVRDTTDARTRAALLAGPPYPDCTGREFGNVP